MAKKDPYREFLKEDFGKLFDEMNLTERQMHFMKSRWLDQMLWLDGKAGKCRDQYYKLRLTAIILGVIVPIIISIDLGEGRIGRVKQYVTIGISAIVATSAAVEEFFHYGERWNHYRRTAESMKTQVWQYASLTGPYKKFTTHQAAFKSFATQVEDVIQKDVEVYVTQIAKAENDKDEQQEDEDLMDAVVPMATAAVTEAVTEAVTDVAPTVVATVAESLVEDAANGEAVAEESVAKPPSTETHHS